MTDYQEPEFTVKPGIGLSQVFRRHLKDQIPLCNLNGLLIAIGWIVNYDFDEADWVQVLSLIADTNMSVDLWCDYELVGTHCARLRFALNNKDDITVDINTPVELLPQVRLALDIFSTFNVGIKIKGKEGHASEPG